MPCRIEFTFIDMTVTDWSFTFGCSPPHLTVTQLLQVTAQSTFGLDRSFTFLFHNHYRRTGKGACARKLTPATSIARKRASCPTPACPLEVCGLARKTHKKSLSKVVEDVKLLFYKDLTEQRQQPGQ